MGKKVVKKSTKKKTAARKKVVAPAPKAVEIVQTQFVNNQLCSPPSPKCMQLSVENTTYETKRVDLFAQTIKLVDGLVIKNEMIGDNRGLGDTYEFTLKSLLHSEFRYHKFRVISLNPRQFEQEILYIKTDALGSEYARPIMPFIYFEESQMQFGIMEKADGGMIDYGTRLSFDVLPKTTVQIQLMNLGYNPQPDINAPVKPWLSWIKVENKTKTERNFKTDFSCQNIDDINAAREFELTFPERLLDRNEGLISFYKVYAPSINESLLFNIKKGVYSDQQFHTGGPWGGDFQSAIIYNAKTNRGEIPSLKINTNQTLDVNIPAGKYVYLCVNIDHYWKG